MKVDWKLIALALVVILGVLGHKQLETVFSRGRDLLFSGVSLRSGEEIFEPEPVQITLPDIEDNTEMTEVVKEALSEEEAEEAAEAEAEIEWQSEDAAQAKTTVSIVKAMTLEEAEAKVKEIQRETDVLAKEVTKFVETQNKLAELQKQVNEISAKVGVISQEIAEFTADSPTS